MQQVPFGEALAVWWRIGWLSFGGPAGQIALMHRVLVEEKRWLDEARFLHALNYCMLLPGPEAQQLATYVGWLLHGVRGGIVAGVLFVLPGALIILMLAWLYVLLGDLSAVAGVLFGFKAAVLAIVAQALIRVAQRTLRSPLQWLLAIGGFVALFVFDLPFPLVVVLAGLAGVLLLRNAQTPASDDLPITDTVQRPGTLRAALICLMLWLLTLAVLWATLGTANVFSQLAAFFSGMALVTFGGAYAVLAYVAQYAVEQLQWLQAGEMLDGLALAETTPGPLILVVEFAGFLAAYKLGGLSPPLLAGTLGALLTLWVTFLPCFIWIFAGAPYVEKLRHHRGWSAALSAITAAVVGVIANLALWFAINALFANSERYPAFGMNLLLPEWGSLNWAMLGLGAFAFVLVFAFRANVLIVLASCAVAGIALA